MTDNDLTLRVETAGKTLEFRPVDESPCRRACPAGIDVKRYVGQIASGNFEGALSTIRKHMPFPSACGRICIHPCQTECARGQFDEPIAIMALKRFVIDRETRKGVTSELPIIEGRTGKKVAIIGSGPAGLTAAHDLALYGHEITVFERYENPGGLLTHAIPELELPSATVNRDIARITELGVKIECNHEINGEAGVRELLNDGFDAVLIATGSSGRWFGFDKLGWIPGGDLGGVLGAAKFMSIYRTGIPENDPHPPGKIIVLGSGVQALGCARTAVRLGCPNVTWIIPLSKDQLQPDPRRVGQAIEEGVNILELTRPIEILGENGEVTGIRCVEVELSEPDHTGRRNVSAKGNTEKIIECDTVIDAMYFAPDENWGDLSTGPWGVVAANPDTMATSIPGVFAAGDVVSGAKSVVEAVALGHRAAAGIDSYLLGFESEIGTLATPIEVYGWEIEDPAEIPSKPFRPAIRNAEERKTDFNEPEVGFTAWEAEHEARRCLLCGPCEECAVCVAGCRHKKGVLFDSEGNPVFVRVPIDIARGLIGGGGGATELALYTAVVDPDRCRSCGVCEEICGYHAPRVAPDNSGRFVSSIDVFACKGCGTCIAACPSGAIDQGGSSHRAVYSAVPEVEK